jgi:hypothetical protein
MRQVHAIAEAGIISPFYPAPTSSTLHPQAHQAILAIQAVDQMMAVVVANRPAHRHPNRRGGWRHLSAWYSALPMMLKGYMMNQSWSCKGWWLGWGGGCRT